MASNSGKPARPSAAPAAATKSTGLPRQGLVAVVLLPVLLAAGFFLGSQLTGGSDTGETPTAIGASAEPSDVATDTPAGPELPSEEPAPAATTEAPATAPTTEAPATEAPAAAPTTEAPAPEPTTAAPTTEPPATEPPATEAPAPTQEPTTEAPSPEPTATASEAPAESPTAAPAPADNPATTATAPEPVAGDAVLLFRGFAGEDVRTWQARMVERGWDLEVDGIYGAESESVAERFQAEKGLAVDGIVGTVTWDAAWTAPIT